MKDPYGGIRKAKMLQNFERYKTGEIVYFETEMAIKLAEKKIIEPLGEQEEEQEKNYLKLKNFSYFKKLKKDKRFLVEKFIYPRNTIMWYSPPGQFKSLLSLYMATAISNGRLFLGMRTKKMPVLVCDRENNEQILKERIIGIFKGMKLRMTNFPLHFLIKDGDLNNEMFVERLKTTINDKKIKLVIFDTLHRFADYEENAVDDINRIYTSVFQPIIDECDCSIMFLHHTNKEGGYRGSSDFLGMVDAAYSIKRVPKTNQFNIINEKSRGGEVDEVPGEIVFDENFIHFVALNKEELRSATINKLKDATFIIKSLFAIPGDTMTRREILDHFELKHPDKYSVRTIERSIRFLVRENQLDAREKGKYIRMWSKEGS